MASKRKNTCPRRSFRLACPRMHIYRRGKELWVRGGVISLRDWPDDSVASPLGSGGGGFRADGQGRVSSCAFYVLDRASLLAMHCVTLLCFANDAQVYALLMHCLRVKRVRLRR